MAPDADATAGASQGWHDLEAVLAEEPAATLLAAYLGRRAGRPARRRPGDLGWVSISSPGRSRGRRLQVSNACAAVFAAPQRHHRSCRDMTGSAWHGCR